MRRNATLTAMLACLASEDTTRVGRDRRTVFPPQRNGQPGAWPECHAPPRSSVGTAR